MKLTKARLIKIINTNNKQTRKKFKKNVKVLNHVNTVRNKKQFNLRNTTVRNWN
jgi:uncharacterized protein YkuJ